MAVDPGEANQPEPVRLDPAQYLGCGRGPFVAPQPVAGDEAALR